MVLFALSLQGQVEKYGSYVGIAAFFGLAVLSLLYFAQAREVKRLREWAGRAPERAREVEERALAAAEEARRRPAPAPAAQPRPQAAPVAAAPAAATAGARSGTVGPAVPVAAAGAAVAEQERPVGGEGGEPVAHGPLTEDGKPPAPALPRPSDADEPELAERDDEDPRDEAEDGDPEDDASPAAAPTNGAPPAGAQTTVLPRPSTAAAAGAGAATARPATPAPAPTGGNAPAGPGGTRPAGTGADRPVPAMPVRAGMPSASPRRSAPLPPRRPAPAPAETSSGRGGRRWAIAGGVAAVLAALGVFAATQLLNKDSSSSKGAAATATPAVTSNSTSTAAGGTPASRADTTVAVFNGTTINGLAANTADKLASSGYKRGSTGDFTDQQRSSSTIFYRRDARRQARDISRELHISDLRPMDAETQALAGDRAEVAVVVGSDKAP